MAGPEDLGPLGAYLVGEEFGWCSGRVLFAGGSEVAIVDEPRLLEVVRTDDGGLARPGARGCHPPGACQSRGQPGQRGRWQPPVRPHLRRAGPRPTSHRRPVRSCAVVTDRPGVAASLTAALEARSITCHRLEFAHGFGAAAKALSAVVEAAGPIDAIVVAPAGRSDDDHVDGRLGAGAG